MGLFDDIGNAVGDAADAIAGAASDAGDAAADAANDVGNAFDAAANAIADAADDAANALSGWVSSAMNSAKQVVNEIAHVADDAIRSLETLGSELVAGAKHDAVQAADFVDAGAHFAEHAVDDPLGTAREVVDDAGKAASDVGDFIKDNSGAIITGAEIAGMVALYASGVGAPVAAVISGGTVAATDAAEGKDAGDCLVDGGAAALDKLVPGAGSALRATVDGVEHGESAGQIAKDAGLSGLGADGGPLLGLGATIARDASDGADAGTWGRDLVNEYAGQATAGNPLGQFGVAAVNDALDGKDASAYAYDAVRVYLHQAAGGDVSPIAQLSDTAINDLKDGKSLDATLSDVENQAVGDLTRVSSAAPGALGDVVSGSGIPGTGYVATVVSDVVAGKSLEQIGVDVGKQVVGDAYEEAGLNQQLKDAGVDTSVLNPLKPYGDTVVNDVTAGKGLADIGADLAREGLKDASDRSGIGDQMRDAGFDSKALEPAEGSADKALGDLFHGNLKAAGSDLLDGGKQVLQHAAENTVSASGLASGLPSPDDLDDPRHGGPVSAVAALADTGGAIQPHTNDSDTSPAAAHGLGQLFASANEMVGYEQTTPAGTEPAPYHGHFASPDVGSAFHSVDLGPSSATSVHYAHVDFDLATAAEPLGSETTIHSGDETPSHFELPMDHHTAVFHHPL